MDSHFVENSDVIEYNQRSLRPDIPAGRESERGAFLSGQAEGKAIVQSSSSVALACSLPLKYLFASF